MCKKNINKNKITFTSKESTSFFTFGNLNPKDVRSLVLLILIIFVMTFMLVSYMRAVDESIIQPAIPVHLVKSVSALDKEINRLVSGYPIEEMTPYILKQDPKTAVFLIAIAKKESAWGKHHPVLNGEDCYNYWGFRLKSEKMGSGGHTCFDSPQQAVSIIAGRIDELVKEEKIDTPQDMIIWKCGYGCQDKLKTVAEKKWISDVDMYYSKLKAYL